MRTRTVVLISLCTLIVSIITLPQLIPSVDDLWIENPFWNGLSEAYTELNAELDTGITQLPPGNSTVLMLGPSTPYSEAEVITINNYLNEGGRVVLTDDFGSGNTLLQDLGINARFTGSLLEDKLFKEKHMMPKILAIKDSPLTVGVDNLVLNYPTTITGIEEDEGLAYASYFSELTNTTQKGPFLVLAEIKMGKGTLILISDSSIFINDMLKQGDNAQLLKNTVRGTPYIDETHSTPSRMTIFRQGLTSTYELLDHPEVKYSLAIVAAVAVFKVTWSDKEEQTDEVEETLKRHPEWSRRELEELREARRRIHGE